MEEKNKVTKDEWIAFMEVRQDGQYNMFSPEARNSAGLDKDKWKNIISCLLYTSPSPRD